MIAETALKDLREIAFGAFLYGYDGRITHGYRMLREGRDSAARSGDWNEELASCWERLLQEYRERFPREWYADLAPAG